MNIARNAMIYGVGSAASRLVAILLVPLYTRTLSIKDYGHLEVLLGVYALTILLAGLQSESAVARDYFDAKERGELPKLFGAATVVTLGGSALLILGVAILQLLAWIPADSVEFLPLLLAMTIPSQFLGIQLVIMRFGGAPLFFAFLSLLDLCLCALFSTLFILQMDLGIFGALAGILIGKSICVLLAWPRTFGSLLRAGPSSQAIRHMLAYSMPQMPSVLLNWLQTNGSRILLAIFMSLRDVAIAGVAMKVAALYLVVIYSFRLAWEPYSIAKLPALEHDPHIYNRALQWYILVMFVAAGLASMASPFLVWLLAPPAYSDAAAVAGFFIIGQFWIGASAILCIGIHGARVTSRLTYVYSIGAVTNVVALATLVELLGLAAAAVGFMASAMVTALLCRYYSEKHYNTGFSLRLIILALTMSALFATGCCLLFRHVAYPGAALERHLIAYAAIIVMLLAMTATIAWRGFETGRARLMWSELTLLIRPKAVEQ